MVHLVEIGGCEFSMGRLVRCRCPFTELILTALALQIRKCIWKTRNPAAPEIHHEIHSSPATATTSKRCATKHVPRVSPSSPFSINPGFVEIGLVQLSQSAKTTNTRPVTMETRSFHRKLRFQRYPPKDFCTARYEHKSSKKKFQTFKKPRKKKSWADLGPRSA